MVEGGQPRRHTGGEAPLRPGLTPQSCGHWPSHERRAAGHAARSYIRARNLLRHFDAENASNGMKSDSLEQLDSVIVEATRGLFDSLGVPVMVATSTVPIVREAELACSIGFASAKVSGNLLILCDSASVSRCLPPELRADTTSDATFAWTGELSNQLLGRIKNRLLPYGITFAVGTPTFILGVAALPRTPRLAVRRSVDISGDGISLLVLLEVEGIEELEGPIQTVVAYCEGEGELF